MLLLKLKLVECTRDHSSTTLRGGVRRNAWERGASRWRGNAENIHEHENAILSRASEREMANTTTDSATWLCRKLRRRMFFLLDFVKLFLNLNVKKLINNASLGRDEVKNAMNFDSCSSDTQTLSALLWGWEIEFVEIHLLRLGRMSPQMMHVQSSTGYKEHSYIM